MFVRNEDGICVDENNFPEGVGYEEKTNDNRLFLSLCQQLGGEISRQVISWFQSDFNVISGLNNQQYRAYSKLFFHKKESLSVDALNFFQKLRLGFNNILTHEEEPNIPQDLPMELRALFQRETQGKKSIELDSIHNVYSDKGNIVGTINFSFEDRESSGTNKLFDLSGPIFETLYSGSVLVIDELDAKMHPLISQYIIELFNNFRQRMIEFFLKIFKTFFLRNVSAVLCDFKTGIVHFTMKLTPPLCQNHIVTVSPNKACGYFISLKRAVQIIIFFHAF